MSEIAGEPRYAPMIIADKTCALAIAGAVSAALFARERTGRGQFVEIPMFEQMVSFVLGEHLFGHNFVPPMGSLGYTRVLASWRRPYKTKDGYLCMMAYTQEHWRKFWPMVGKPEMHSDPRFDSIASRARNIVALYELAGACIADKTTDEWLLLLRQLEIPAARMSSLDDIMTDPQLKASGFFKRANHPSEGEILYTDLPVRFSDGPTSSARLQPRLGEHSIEVLREAGLSDREIETLAASGATVTREESASGGVTACHLQRASNIHRSLTLSFSPFAATRSRLHHVRRVKLFDLDQTRGQTLLKRILRDGLYNLAIGFDAVMQQHRLGIAGQQSRREVILDVFETLRIGDIVRLVEGLEKFCATHGSFS